MATISNTLNAVKTLASGISRGVIKRAIRRAYLIDQSGAATLRRLRDLGYRIRNQAFYDLRREVIASTPLPFDRVFADRRDTLSLRQHIFTEDNFPTTFKYVVQVQAQSSVSGDPYTFRTGIYSDETLSGEEIESIVRNRFSDAYTSREDFAGSDRALQWHGTFDSIKSFQAFQHQG